MYALRFRFNRQAISTIFTLELPKQGWPDLIPNLASNTNNEQLEIRKAAIMTLGDICEKLKHEKMQCLELSQVENIMMGICLGMKKDETHQEIKLIAVKAMRDSMAFMEPLFHKVEVRNYMAGLLIGLCQNEQDSVKIPSIQAIIEFCKYNYDRLDQYIVALFNATSPLIISANNDLAVAATEV